MVLYKLLVTFELRSKNGEVTQKSLEKIEEFSNVDAAENALSSEVSGMISQFSQDSFEWTILEKCIVNTQEQKESDHIALVVE